MWSAINNIPKLESESLKKSFIKFANKRLPIHEPIEEEILADLFKDFIKKVLP